jgi:hypothetical protein
MPGISASAYNSNPHLTMGVLLCAMKFNADELEERYRDVHFIGKTTKEWPKTQNYRNQREARQSERPFIILSVPTGNGLVTFILSKVPIHLGEKTMKKFAFVFAALAALAFAAPTAQAHEHHHHHHHHHMMHR